MGIVRDLLAVTHWLGPMLGQEADHQLPVEGEVLVLVASEPLPQVPSIDSLDMGNTCTIYLRIYSLP